VWALAQGGKSGEARAEIRAYATERVEALRKEQARAKRPAEKSEEDWKKSQEQAVARLELDLKVDLSRSLSSGGAYPAAEAVLKEVLAREPDNPAALQLLGDAALRRQDWKAARDAYARVREKQPRNLVVVNNLAWLAAEKFGDVKQALLLVEELQRGRNGKPIGAERLLPDALDTIGLVYTKARDVSLYPRMRELFEAAARRYPGDPRMSLFVGHAYAGLDDARKARQAYDAAIEKANREGVLDEAQRQAVKSQAEEAKRRLRS
jgi:tetratricopeptide (TPR) repeat protein